MADIEQITLPDGSTYNLIDSTATHIQSITMAQWESLTPEQKASGDYVITDATLVPLSASTIPYDNTTSGLSADDVQDAIDELSSEKVDSSSLATVATSGSYNDLDDKPTIPAAQVNSDWNSSSGVSEILNKPNLATVATTGAYSDLTGTPAVDTTVTSGSSNLITSGAVYTAIDNLPEPMVFKGSLGTGGTITALPVDGTATIGDTYKVITAGTYASQSAKVGDTFICDSKTSSANTWVLIPSGDEPSGTVTSITIQANSPISVDSSSAITTSGTRTISHATSGATAGSYGDTSAQTPGYGSTFKALSATVDTYGHITSIGEHTVKIPDAPIVDTTLSSSSNNAIANSAVNTALNDKMDKTNPTGTGKLSLNRASGSSEGTNSVAIGEDCIASGKNSYAEGYQTTASGNTSHSEGGKTSAISSYAHSEGTLTLASGNYAHAEGSSTSATNAAAHSEGYNTTASGEYSHAEGQSSTASGQASHAEGYNTVASGTYSHAGGSTTTASGTTSTANGIGTIAKNRSQNVFGEFNTQDPSTGGVSDRGNYVEIVGKGSSDSNRSNARTLDWSGNETLAGDLIYNGSTSLTEKFNIEKSASGSLVSFNDGGDNIPLKSLIANITAVQAGSGIPSPSNVRAISGWSECKVFKTGKNLLNDNQKYYDDHNRVYFGGANSTTTKSLFLPAGTYTYTIKYSVSAPVNLYLYNADTGSAISGFPVYSTSSKTFTLDTPTNISAFTYSTSITSANDVDYAIIEQGSPSATYEPYTGTTITLPFGQTVYGGTLDVLSGVLKVTHGYKKIKDLTWTYASSAEIFYTDNISDKKQYQVSAVEPLNISIYAPISNAISVSGMPDYSIKGQAGDVRVYIKDSRYSDTTTFKSSVGEEIIVYELATPVTYQLTPAQVSTLLGLNNIFADTGDISLSYFTQNANAINDIAESNTRTALNTDVPKTDLTDIFVTGAKNNTGSTITKNKFFYLNGTLVVAKADISANANLTLNTNYVVATAKVLNDLYNILQTVTPTSSDKLLVVQSQGQGLVAYGAKLDSNNPVATGSLSMGRTGSKGTNSIALGTNCEASGNYSFATGDTSKATGARSHAEGARTTASGERSHAEGNISTASGTYSHAENYSTTASGEASHAEGSETTAEGRYSHSEGEKTTAGGYTSHAEGLGTKASRRSQHVFGEYNVEETGATGTKGVYVEMVGNGNSSTPSNARTLDWSGNEVLAGDLTIKGNVSVGDALTFSSGEITWNNTNVTGDTTRKVWQKLGRLVIACIEFTPIASKISHQTVIATGFPLPLNSNYSVFDNGGQQVRVGTNGDLSYYFPTDTTTIRRHDLTIVYFTA